MTIPAPNFYLKNVQSNEPTLIYLQSKYSHNGSHRLMISTGDHILPRDWDFEKKRAIVNKKNPASNDINLWLDKMDAAFKSVFRNCLIDGIAPTAQVVKEKMEVLLDINQVKSTKVEITFYSFIEKFIQESKSFKSINTVKSNNLSLIDKSCSLRNCNKNQN